MRNTPRPSAIYEIHMYERHEDIFQFAVKLPNGNAVYRLEKEEADAVRDAIAHNRPIPPARARRLLPFGQGVEVVGGRVTASYRGVHLGVFPSLKKALKAWDAEERHERFSLEQDAERKALDERYYADLSYDEDGYKVFRPRSSAT